jgi:hypothetical protein
MLHRVLWSAKHGPIAPGFEIHHRNGDKGDNRLCNLQLLSVSEHKRLHGPENGRKSAPWHRSAAGKAHHRAIGNLAWKRNPVRAMRDALRGLEKARRAAPAWHRSPAGRAWHRKHGIATWAKRKRLAKRCVVCGARFTAYWLRAKYCGPNCYAKAFRQRARILRLGSRA